MKILLPVDGSEHTQRMLAYISAHGELLGAGHDYIAFTALPAISPHASRVVDAAQLKEWYAEQAEAVLAPVRTLAQQQGWTLRCVHQSGHAAEAIAAFAEAENVDLIVMGTHGQSALWNVVLGSVTTGVLARSKRPVLLVR